MKKEDVTVILVPDDRLGGAESVLKKIASHSLLQDKIVHVFFLKKSMSDGWNDLQLSPKCFLHFTHSKNEKGGIFSMAKNLCRISRKNNITITYSSHIHLIALVSVLQRLRLYKTKYLITRELTMIFERFTSFRLWTFKLLYFISRKFVDLKIFQTQDMLDSFNNNLKNASKYNSLVIHNPVDLDDLHKKSHEFEPSLEGKYIVACGRLNKVKGFDLLIEAFETIQDSRFNLVIIGDGPEKENLLHLQENSPIKNQILFLGHSSNPIPYFRTAFGCVLSSRIEGFPNVLLEMMSQNGRIVSTDCAGGIDKIANLQIAEKGNVDSLGKALQELVNISDEQSEHNHQSFLKYLDDKSIHKYMKTIENAIAN